MKNSLASILVTSFNHQKFILRCLSSIQGKCLEEIELIISDDGSIDDSPSLIKSWIKKNQKRFKRIIFFARNKNEGISVRIKEMICEARSDILLPLASDDMYFPETVDQRIKFLNDNQDIWVGFSDASVLNASGETIVRSLYKYYKHKFTERSCAALKKELILNWNYPANIQFWRKGAWIKEITSGMFSEDLEIGLFALLRKKFKYLNKILYQYRITDWPIKTKGCEKTKRLHLSYYYRKAANNAKGVSRLALLILSRYNLNLAVGDGRGAKREEKKLNFLKKVPSSLF